MNDQLEKADAILIPGSAHKELALEAANLYHQGYAKKIVPSGAGNKKLVDHNTEYEFLRDVLIDNGVDRVDIIEESKAKHTFDNAYLSYQAIANIKPKRVILLCKGYHSRRAYMTYRYAFPKDVDIIVHSVVGAYDIRKNNWFENDYKIQKVMTEVEKIGGYFKDRIEEMSSNNRGD